jgi:hypothetical protein
MAAKPRTMATLLHISARPVRPLISLDTALPPTRCRRRLLDILPAMSSPLTPRVELPRRSAEQRREALAQANQVRTQRALLKTDLKRGSVSITALIADPPPYLASAKVVELLRALPGYGPIKATRLLERCHVSPTKSVEGLTERQRAELIRTLGT